MWFSNIGVRPDRPVTTHGQGMQKTKRRAAVVGGDTLVMMADAAGKKDQAAMMADGASKKGEVAFIEGRTGGIHEDAKQSDSFGTSPPFWLILPEKRHVKK